MIGAEGKNVTKCNSFDRKEETGQLKSKIHNSFREGNNEILNKNRRRLVILDFDRRKK